MRYSNDYIIHQQNLMNNQMHNNTNNVYNLVGRMNNLVENYIKKSNRVLKENFSKMQRNSFDMINSNNERFEPLLKENLYIMKGIEKKFEKFKKFEKMFLDDKLQLNKVNKRPAYSTDQYRSEKNRRNELDYYMNRIGRDSDRPAPVHYINNNHRNYETDLDQIYDFRDYRDYKGK